MLTFAIRRILYAIPILLGVSIVVFGLMQLAPGDVADILIPPEAPKEVADILRAKFGLDKPVHVQYLLWVGNILQGDLGVSAFTNRAVGPELFGALGNTLKLAVPAAILGCSLGVILGGLAAFNHGTWLDRFFSALAITGVSLPHYWVGIVLVAIFAVIWNMLPAQGMGPPGFPASWEQVKHLILPVITLSLIPMALMGLQFGYLLGGSILVETVFNWPGSGNLMNLAIFRRDVAVLSATILVLATIFVVINIAVDILQAVIDPRMRR